MGNAERFRFYEEDIVGMRDESQERATVTRTWRSDEALLLAASPSARQREEDTPLSKGEYMLESISDMFASANSNGIELIDRSFQVGDICKNISQDSTDLMSGIVGNIRMMLNLQNALTGEQIPEWVPSTNVRLAACLIAGDHVIYGDWVGVVDSVFEEALLKVQGRERPYKVFAIDSEVRIGSPSMATLDAMQLVHSAHVGLPLGITAANSQVIAVRQTAVNVTWLAINQRLSQDKMEKCTEPKMLFTDLESLCVIRPFASHKYALGDAVILDRMQNLLSADDDTIFRVVDCQSEFEVVWQDGTRCWQRSTTLEPFDAVEDHFAWPGDHVIIQDEQGKSRGAIVHAMDVKEQTASVTMYGDKGEPKLVSILDCKSEGSPDFPRAANRGDTVLIADHDTGFTPPIVAALGKTSQVSIWEEEEREDSLIKKAKAIAKKSDQNALSQQRQPQQATEFHSIDWYGVVVDCSLDGRIVVQLPSGRLLHEPVSRLSRLSDGFEGDEGSEEDDQYDGDYEEVERDSECRCGMLHDDDDIPWTSDTLAVDPLSEADWEDIGEMVDQAAAVEIEDHSIPEQSATEALSRFTFRILEQAPSDHAFLKSLNASSQQKKFLSRAQREHKILSSSLPDSILVRTYEDRMDLFRTVIIGSQGTPYEDAPICIDLQLGPNFPAEPPLAHFHSWSRGHGRISPNLYEEHGRVCLSILNTWHGEQTETWNPGKSTLLQIFVSILGLVLVAEPFFTEPGFEKMADTATGQESSRLYSEKAYVLSRYFIAHALQNGVEGFQEDLERMYGVGGRLPSAILKARRLLAQENRASESVGIASLTKGAAIALRKALNELEELASARGILPV